MHPKERNVLLIMCDQLNASVLSAYGGSVYTPNIDKLANNGVAFTSAYCQTPICSPSRASIITGLYPHHHGIVSNVFREDYPSVGGPDTEEGIDNRDITTEGILHNIGYDTTHIGKWHLSGEQLSCYLKMYREHQEFGCEMKPVFDKIVQGTDRERYMDWYDWILPVSVSKSFGEACERIPAKWKSLPRLNDFYSKIGKHETSIENIYDWRIASKCINAIESATKPFMITCSFNMPHDPNVVPAPYYDDIGLEKITADVNLPCEYMYHDDLSKNLPYHAGREFLIEFMRVYYASVKMVDDQIGRILDSLERRNLLSNTLIIFTADHGDMAGGHGMFWKSTNAFYDEVARVPLIVSTPEGRSAAHYDKPVELVDIMPTILELCGQSCPPDIDGVSLVPAIMGGTSKKQTALCERLHFSADHRRYQHTGNEPYSFMFRDSQYKYVVHNDGPIQGRFLYDLLADPLEYSNVLMREGGEEIARKIHKDLAVHLSNGGYILTDNPSEGDIRC